MQACMAAVLVGVECLLSWALSMVPGAWSVSCAFCRSFVLSVGMPCLLFSLAGPGVWSFLRGTHMAFGHDYGELHGCGNDRETLTWDPAAP